MSDLKSDKTLYLEKTPNKTQQQDPISPFETKEISARSTTFKNNYDFDAIMQTSLSAAVRNKYRESMSTGRLSAVPSKSNQSSGNQRDFWDYEDDINPSFSSLTGKNITYSNEDFRPAEEMVDQLDEDEKMQEMEYADIPVIKVNEMSNWEENQAVSSSRGTEMSFGQYCAKNIRADNIRDVYGNKSPPRRQNRVALVELSTNESLKDTSSTKDVKPNYHDTKKLEKFISKCFPFDDFV